jgi:uncharacterized membrane protein YdjX (TVP38/TMEM64 family)
MTPSFAFSPRPRRLWLCAVLLLAAAMAVLLLHPDTARTGWEAMRSTWEGAAALPPLPLAALLLVVFTLLSLLSLPGCSVLALSAGVWFGLALGTAIVLLASTLGATLSFLLARRYAREPLRRRITPWLQRFEAALERDSARLLFTLRMAPVIPFGLLNPLMGLTRMSTRRFAAVSAVGMLPGSAAYVYAGVLLGQAATWRDVFSPPLLALLVLCATLPWCVRRWSRC